jgi:hypothetical protein
VRERRLAAEEHAVDVHAKGRAPVGLGEVGNRAQPADARVVDEEVQVPEGGERALDHPPGSGPLAHVRHDGDARAAQRRHLRGDGGGACGVEVVDADPVPAAGEAKRDRPPDAAAGAGDEGGARGHGHRVTDRAGRRPSGRHPVAARSRLPSPAKAPGSS